MDLLGDPAGRAEDAPDAVRVDGRGLSRAELLARAAAVAAEIGGAEAVAVHATATVETVVAVVGGILAGVPVVPLPPDSGPAERDHILGDSKARLLMAARDAFDPAAGGPPSSPWTTCRPHRPRRRRSRRPAPRPRSSSTPAAPPARPRAC
ncbi:AMP-binding protein [Actinomadura keratinilytica]|uniref:AMP-binding protein n=1 Tax=Actinomadura keratinilytica TaxID=547461 RepID=UPI003622C022